jgi:hypothetical protein
MDAGAGEVRLGPARNLSPLTPLSETERGEPDQGSCKTDPHFRHLNSADLERPVCIRREFSAKTGRNLQKTVASFRRAV